MKEYIYDHAQGNNSSTIRYLSVLECIGESIGQNFKYTTSIIGQIYNGCSDLYISKPGYICKCLITTRLDHVTPFWHCFSQ